MTDFVSELKSAVAEEAIDKLKYLRLAEIAPEKYSSMLKDIAAEEGCHRKHLLDILSDCGESFCESENSPPKETVAKKTSETKDE